MFTITWITEKELQRGIENKEDEFRRKKNLEIETGGEKMRNASASKASKVKMRRQWKIKASVNAENKILGKHVRQFLHKNNL